MKSPQRNRLLARDPGTVAPARRLDQRHRLTLPVSIVADGLRIDAESLDLGLGGICIRADITHAPGCEVDLSIGMHAAITRVAFTARVVWRDGRRAGLCFTAVDPLHLWALTRVLPG